MYTHIREIRNKDVVKEIAPLAVQDPLLPNFISVPRTYVVSTEASGASIRPNIASIPQ